MSNDNRPIGIFESGLGGLTVVAAIRRQLPHEDILYLGDNARVPYGSKSKDTVIRFALEDAAFLINRGVKCIVIACNTASALALPALKKEFPDTPFISVVDAGVASTLSLDGIERVLLIATAATVNSDSYRMQIHQSAPKINVRSLACPMFVPLVEEGWTSGAIVEAIADEYLSSALSPPPDALILGCTHYPLLKDLIISMIPDTTQIIDSSLACADLLVDYLTENAALASPNGEGAERYFLTDMPASFFQLAGRFLGRQPQHVDKVTLG